MTIEILYTTDAENNLNKKLKSFAKLDGTLKEECSIFSPSIMLRIPKSLNIFYCNYVHIPEFKRYYKITNVDFKYYGKDDDGEFSVVVLSCKNDPLYTFREYIKKLPAVVSRGTEDAYLQDDSVLLYANPVIQTVEFPNKMPDPRYILVIVGKDVTENEAASSNSIQ